MLVLTSLKWAARAHAIARVAREHPIDVGESIDVQSNGSSREVVPLRPFRVETALQMRYQVPLVGESALDESYPSLREWIHPVSNSPELMPEQSSRHFGAERIDRSSGMRWSLWVSISVAHAVVRSSRSPMASRFGSNAASSVSMAAAVATFD